MQLVDYRNALAIIINLYQIIIIWFFSGCHTANQEGKFDPSQVISLSCTLCRTRPPDATMECSYSTEIKTGLFLWEYTLSLCKRIPYLGGAAQIIGSLYIATERIMLPR